MRSNTEGEIQVTKITRMRVPLSKHWDGAVRSSVEVDVTAMERRDCIKQVKFEVQLVKGGDFEQDKTFHHL